MDIKEIKQIVDLMKRSGLTEFEIEEDNFKLRICRSNGDAATAAAPVAMAAPVPVAAPVATPVSAPEQPAAIDPAKLIKSPMVGTFYSAPSPDSSSFVKIGDKVSADSVVCILEAMKVMNEILAEKSGIIAEILIQNGDSVEYGQPLFRLQ